MSFLTKFLNKKKSISHFNILLKLAAGLLLIAILSLTSWVAYQRIGAFGCFDQCFNFVAAYFMLKGKQLYSQIFFNHQPLMAYLSYLIQKVSQPATLYQLVIYHRLFTIIFSLLMSALFVWRFRWKGVGFVLFFETSKFYLMGQFFLPEVIVAYLLAFLMGLWWQKHHQKNALLVDYFLAAIFAWAAVFLTLPYLPLTLSLYLAFLMPLTKKSKISWLSLGFFVLLSLGILIQLPLNDYFFQTGTINRQLVVDESQRVGLTNLGMIKIFFYPWLIFIQGKASYFRHFLIGLGTLFSGLTFWFVFKTKQIKKILLIIFFLGLATVRFVEPGTMFYEAFHLLVWQGLFLMSLFLLSEELMSHQTYWWLKSSSFLLLFYLLGYLVLSPISFLREKVNSQEEFTTQYAPYFAHGTVIKTLSKPDDTLFLEQWDDLIYWTSSLDSSYPYSLYTPIMAQSSQYREARLKMFQNNPPDFYYSFPEGKKNCPALLPEKEKDKYIQLYFSNNPSCLYLKKTKLPEINDEQWKEIQKLGFHML